MVDFIKRNTSELIACTIFMFFAFGFNIYRVQGDGDFYYAFLTQIFNLEQTASPTGFMQSGCAYFNAPFYLAACAIEQIFNKFWNFDGITLRTISINIASNFYMLISIILVIKILKTFNFKYFILPVLSVLFSTSAFVSAVVMPSYTHTCDIFITTLFVYLFLKNEGYLPYRAIYLGFLQVIAILVRYFNFLFMAPVLIYYFVKKDYSKIGYFLLGFISIIGILPLLFYIYNGSLFSAFGGVKDLEQLVSQRTALFPKYFFKVLLHPLHGLFIWSPILIMSFMGLFMMPKAKERYGYILLGIWLLLTMMNSFSPTWYAGWSFSNRYMTGIFPIYVIGLASFFEKCSSKLVLLAILCTLYSVFLFFNWYLCVINGEFGTPFNMFNAWWNGESDTFYVHQVNCNTFLKKIYDICRYKYLLTFIN